ncbi:MAG: phosphoribosylanthranilate isomerase [Actinomycetes bacterium]
MFVKICGITNEEDALLSVAMGADALGFIFAAGSPRMMSGEHVRDIVKRIPPGIATIGVFRNERPERVVEIVQRCGLSGAQLHGHEPITEVQWIRARLPFVIQAFAAHDRGIAAAVAGPADVVLIDSAAPGTGQVFDWSLAEGMPGGLRLMLAGGLNPENIAAAIAQVRPWGVDVATGVESAPGTKDARKLRRFILSAKEAGDALLAMPQSADALRPYDWELDGEGNPGQSRDVERQGPPSLRIV